MKHIIEFVIAFLIIYLTYLFLIILRKKKLEKFKDNTYVKYLVKVNKLNKKNLNMKLVANAVALSNAFIIATTFVLVSSINNLILLLVMAFLILIPFQFIIYSIVGKYLKRREEKCTNLKK